MHYRLSFVQPLQESVPAIAASQINAAMERLKAAESDEKAVHAARRHFKRTRALLGLVEPAACGKIARRDQKRLASSARLLAAARDAQAAIAAAVALEKDFGACQFAGFLGPQVVSGCSPGPRRRDASAGQREDRIGNAGEDQGKHLEARSEWPDDVWASRLGIANIPERPGCHERRSRK